MNKTHFLKVRVTFDCEITPKEAARSVRKLLKGETFFIFDPLKSGKKGRIGRITYVSEMPTGDAPGNRYVIKNLTGRK